MKHKPFTVSAFRIVLLLILSPNLIFAASASGKTPSCKSYVYKESGGKPREMEIYFPPNHDPAKAKMPGLILFHGGSWTGGTLDQFRTTCAYFASRGLVCATVEYRMMGKEDAKLPKGESIKRVCVTDAKSAIRWFKQHAGELGVDPNRIITGGGSAGGHISAIATMNPGLNDPADPKEFDTSVVAYLWFNPAFGQAGDKNDPEIDVLQQLKADLPPAIVFFGDQDHWKVGWDAAQAKWESFGTKTIDLRIGPGQKHGFFNKGPWYPVTLIAADEFLVKHGLLTGKPTLQAPATGEKLIPGSGK
jgi:acetyl esterase